MTSSDDLARWRAELDATDRALLDAAARRAEIVAQIGAAKRATADGAAHALFDRERERAVLARSEAYAREIGLDPRVARDVMTALIEASHRAQEAAAITRASETATFVIIGGLGRMGRRLAVDLLARGHEVEAYDAGDDRDLATVVARGDVVMLAVPMAQQVETARRVAPHLRDDALLCDINSLKAEICAAMHDAHGGEVLGIHPMFGPTVHTLRRQKFVVCRMRPGPRSAWLIGELEQIGGEIIDADPERHDRMMALVQVLVHFQTLVMGDALRAASADLGADLEESLRYTSPIYRLELAFIGRLFAQNPDLYAEIVMTNPHGAAIRRTLAEAIERYRGVVDGGDRSQFHALFDEGRAFFADFAEEAMRLSDGIIDSMVRDV